MTRVSLLVWLACVATAGCSDDAGPDDAGPGLDGAAGDGGVDAGGADAGGVDAGPVGPLIAACEDMEPDGTDSLPPVASTLVAGIELPASRVVPDLDFDPSTPDGLAHYEAMGFSDYVHGPPIERVRRTDLGGDAEVGERRSIAWFISAADPQLTDDESPARFAGSDQPENPGGIRPQEAYLTRAMSAMNRTLAELEAADRPYDFGVWAGDCADSAQHNELRWFIQIMDGAAGVHPDSGQDDDLLAGPDNDPKDPFDAVAFPAPWLYVPGNHDVEVVGVLLASESENERAIGERPIFGTRDYRLPNAPVVRTRVPADPDRRLLDRQQIVESLRDTEASPGPIGHGYPEDADLTHGAHYAYDAIPGLLRVLALDSNDATGGSSGLVTRPTVDEWLVPELERAATDGVLVILVSHHATTSMNLLVAEIGPSEVEDGVPPEELEAIVAAHPVVVAWLVGHDHLNRIRAIAGEDPSAPGYWEIQTSAIADWPSQVRLVEIVDNGNDTLSLFATLVDYTEETCMERRYRRLSAVDHVSGWSDPALTDPEHLNVELLIPIPGPAADAVRGAMGFERIESETTLRGE